MPLPGEARRRSSRRGLVLLALMGFLVGLGAAIAIVHLTGLAAWRDPPPPTSADPQLPVSTPGMPAAPSMDLLSAREASLSMRLGDLENRITALDGQARAAARFATRAETLMVLAASRRALDRGLALGYLEGELRRRLGERHPAEVNTVIAASRDPVTVEELRLVLSELRPRLTGGDLSQGVWPSLRQQLARLVTLRRDGSPSPEPGERFVRAEQLLEAGQIGAAMAEVVRLPGAAAAERWLDAASTYVRARRALDLLETAAITSPMPLGRLPEPRAADRPPSTSPPGYLSGSSSSQAPVDADN